MNMKQTHAHKTRKNQSGFTLIELLVVLVIIGVLAGYIGPKIMGRPEEAKRTKAGLQIRAKRPLKCISLTTAATPPPNKVSRRWLNHRLRVNSLLNGERVDIWRRAKYLLIHGGVSLST